MSGIFLEDFWHFSHKNEEKMFSWRIFWALFPTRMRRTVFSWRIFLGTFSHKNEKNPARKSRKKSSGSKQKSAKNPFCQEPALTFFEELNAQLEPPQPCVSNRNLKRKTENPSYRGTVNPRKQEQLEHFDA